MKKLISLVYQYLTLKMLIIMINHKTFLKNDGQIKKANIRKN